MKELCKYILISIMLIALLALLAVDVVSQTRLEKIRYNFTGEKSRIVFDLSGPAAYKVTRDWVDKSIMIDIFQINSENVNKYSTGKWKNYILENAELTETDGGLRLHLTTRNDFYIKYNMLSAGDRLVFDIYPQLKRVPVKTLLKRAQVYEDRGDFAKASVLYQLALNREKNRDDIRYRLAAAFKMNNKINEAREILTEISEHSPYYDKSRRILEVLDTIDNQKTDLTPSVQAIQKEQNTAETGEISETIAEAASSTEIIGGLVDNGEELSSPNVPEASTIFSYEGNTTDNVKPEYRKTKASLIPGVQEILKQSGTENYLLYLLYGVLCLLSIFVVVLTRALIKAYRAPKKKKGGSNTISARNFAHPLVLQKKPADQKKQLEQIRSFAGKLSEMYSKTEILSAMSKTPVKDNSDKVPVMQDHNKTIEEIFTQERDPIPFDSEAARLIRQYRENNITSKSTPDSYEIVRQLAAQNWEVWEIARELSMSSEEIKMALSQEIVDLQTEANKNRYEKIYELADMQKPPSEIARELQLDEEQVQLAIKLRDREKAEVKVA